MLFLTSLAYAFLFPVFALLLPQLAHTAAPAAAKPMLAGLHGCVYVVILLLVRFSRLAWENFGERSAGHERLVRACLEVRGCRWLNLVSIVTNGVGALLMWVAGSLPFQFWFLHAAILVGFVDILGKDTLLELPGDLPTPRVPDLLAPEVPEAAGKACSFVWYSWSEGLTALPCEQRFTIRTDEYEQARSRERFPASPLRNMARYVREGRCDSLNQVVAFFRRRSTQHRLTCEQEMEDIICFVRSVVYAADMETRGVEDWANFPVETLYDERGDCEDHAILAAALLYSLGHDVTLFWLSLHDSAHLALGYRAPGLYGGPFSRSLEGRDYYYIETVPTSSDERAGDLGHQFLVELKSAQLIGL